MSERWRKWQWRVEDRVNMAYADGDSAAVYFWIGVGYVLLSPCFAQIGFNCLINPEYRRMVREVIHEQEERRAILKDPSIWR
jgi:hypothetical protein